MVRIKYWFLAILVGCLIGTQIYVFNDLRLMQKELKDDLDATMTCIQEVEALESKIDNQNLLAMEQSKEPAEVEKEVLPTRDRELITRVVMAEAGNNLEGCLAVAQTIKNRSELWGMTPEEVVNQPKQFATPKADSMEKYPNAVEAVQMVFEEGQTVLDPNVTHFHAEGYKPYWVSDKEFVVSRGGNRFYK